MNKLTKAALFGAIFAVTVGVLSINGISATPLTTQQTSSGYVPVLGHVEYTVRNSEGLVTAYYQSDNLIVDGGDRCAAAKLFNHNGASGSNFNCPVTGAAVWSGPGFTTIAIGNATTTVDNAAQTIGPPATVSVAGELARVNGTVTATTNTGGVVITITNSGHPFKFFSGGAGITISNVTNGGTQTIDRAALFNSTLGTGNDGSATSRTTAFGAHRMFAAQDLAGSGVTVVNGDTLTVTWTVTIGSTGS